MSIISPLTGLQVHVGQSHGQHDWVHGFPELVKSFITFVILSQISCGKVQKTPHIFLHKTVSKFLLSLLSFPRLPRPIEEKTENSPRLDTHFSWSK